MGNCSSCDTAKAHASTAKVILPGGLLQEYSSQVRVSEVLAKEPSCFVCSADDMEFEGFITAIAECELLQLGQLYFVLPRAMLRRKLNPQDMAALAVRASSALIKGGASAVSFAEPYVRVVAASGLSGGGAGGDSVQLGTKRWRRGRRTAGGRSFGSDLGAIPE